MKLYINRKHAHNVVIYIPINLLKALNIVEGEKFVWRVIDKNKLRLIKYMDWKIKYSKPYKLTVHKSNKQKRYSVTLPIALFVAMNWKVGDGYYWRITYGNLILNRGDFTIENPYSDGLTG